jgi:hypothetical protein
VNPYFEVVAELVENVLVSSIGQVSRLSFCIEVPAIEKHRFR